MSPIFSKMVSVSETSQYKIENREDIQFFDRIQIEKATAGERYLWLLHEFGTLLVPLNNRVTEYMQTEIDNLSNYEAYLVTVAPVGEGTVERVSAQQMLQYLVENYSPQEIVEQYCYC